jgi:hypothetical protein
MTELEPTSPVELVTTTDADESAPAEDCVDVDCSSCEDRRLVELIAALTYRECLRLLIAAMLARSPIRCAR